MLIRKIALPGLDFSLQPEVSPRASRRSARENGAPLDRLVDQGKPPGASNDGALDTPLFACSVCKLASLNWEHWRPAHGAK
jgi:hypothetical protein